MKKRISVIACFIFCMSLFSFPACGGKNAEDVIAKNAFVLEDIEKAYVFGFPAVLMYINERVMTNPVKGSGNMPLNQFKNTEAVTAKNAGYAFADADFFHSAVWLELSKEPLVFEIPDMKDRYAFFPVMDAWTNIIASPGKRTTGANIQKYLITAPEWDGEVPDGMIQIKSPTNMAFIFGRIQINSREDGMKNVVALQQKLKLIPLSLYGEQQYEPADKVIDKMTEMSSPIEQIFKMDIAGYFNLLNALLADNPPYEADKQFLNSIQYLKISPGKEFDLSLFDEEKQRAILLIPNIVKERFESASAKKELINGWEFLPFAEASSSQKVSYEERALKVYNKIQIDLPSDTVGMQSFVDGDKMELNGQNKYILRFDKDFLPPVNAFWSLTLYNDKALFSDNSLNRYSVSYRKTLKAGKDGSVEIYIQHENPGKAKESNWLPAPNGSFSLTFRAYWPQEDIIKKKWTVPPVIRVS